MEHVERVNAGAPITVFEVITAVAFHLFAQTPAELCVLEVGLGGRGDATNVIAPPAACAITSISLDHRELLGDTLAVIARGEGRHHEARRAGGDRRAAGGGARGAARGSRADRRARAAARPRLGRARAGAGFRYADARGALVLPPPSLPGAHQLDNAGIAIAALAARRPRRAATRPWPPAWRRRNGRRDCSACTARWRGCCRRAGNSGWTAGTIPAPAMVLGEHLAGWADRPVHLVVGMKQAKDSAEFLRPLLPHAHDAVGGGGTRAASGDAGGGDRRGLRRRGAPRPARGRCACGRSRGEAEPARVLICGSLYLAGEVLKQDA